MEPTTPIKKEDPLAYEGIASPRESRAYERVKPRWVLYTSTGIGYMQVLLYGWSLGQLNYSGWMDPNDCKKRPVKEHTCVAFPGHTKDEWTVIVNVWMLGGMITALNCGRLAQHFGRKRLLLYNTAMMIIGSVVQAAAPNKWIFALGRFLTGMASGIATAVPNGYVTEISPPHLRMLLGGVFQSTVAAGNLFAVASQFVVGANSNWQKTAAFPIVFAIAFLILAPWGMVESPTWLMAHGQQEKAEKEIARLFGEDHVEDALAWMGDKNTSESSGSTDPEGLESGALTAAQISAEKENPWKAMFAPACRLQTILGIALVFSLQFSAINVVYMYSSSIFKSAGIYDGRVGQLIVNIVTLIPPFFAGKMSSAFGNRKTFLGGQVVIWGFMIVLTIAMLVKISGLAVASMALFVGVFALTVGPLTFVIGADLFPEHLRAHGAGLDTFTSWVMKLVIGIGYPYVLDALNDWGFMPFLVMLALLVAFEYKYLPETQGKSSKEIQAIFRARRNQGLNTEA